MAIPTKLTQCGQFVDSRKYSLHRVFCTLDATTSEMEVVLDGLNTEFLDSANNLILELTPYDLVLCRDGAVEAAYTDDGDLILTPIGSCREEDQ